MYKLNSVLRSPVLVLLSRWVGMVAQPAETQQTVTLSGRVTDPWGNLRLGGVATATIDRTEFGLSYNRLLEAGGVTIGEEVRITIDFELTPKQADQ